jgi:hypothetical protein
MVGFATPRGGLRVFAIVLLVALEKRLHLDNPMADLTNSLPLGLSSRRAMELAGVVGHVWSCVVGPPLLQLDGGFMASLSYLSIPRGLHCTSLL